MSLTNDEYEALEQAVFGVATGSSELKTKQETQVEEYIKDGRNRRNQRVRVTDEPNIALAMKLLDQRIGGPQDFC